MWESLFISCIAVFFYVYIGYPALIVMLAAIRVRPRMQPSRAKVDYPTVTVIIAAYNEGTCIVNRIDNIINQAYPDDRLEVIVASDGSTDDTVKKANACGYENLTVLDLKENRGRAIVHNHAVRIAKGGVIIFTDAQTMFDETFIRNIVMPFYDECVGCVVGKLIFRSSGSIVLKNESLYFRYETVIRKAESILDVLATGTGACMAVRKSLYRALHAEEDVDDSLPVYLCKIGKHVKFSPEAIAYDTPTNTFSSQFNARIRMTSKGILGLRKHWNSKAILQHPIITMSLISHKLLRWATIFLLFGTLFSTAMLANKSNVYFVLLSIQIVFYLGLIMAFLFLKHKVRLIDSIISIFIAWGAMGLGLIRGVIGDVPAEYHE